MIIGLAGFARSGKSETARVLNRDHGFEIMPLARPIYRLLHILDPLIWCTGCEHCKSAPVLRYRAVLVNHGHSEESAKVGHPEVRRMLQVIGTEGGREFFGEGVWLRLWGEKLLEQGLHRVGRNVAVPDVRFKNEVASIRAFGGMVWWVSRPGATPLNVHASENSLGPTDVDYVLDNAGDSLHDLAARVRQVLTKTSFALGQKP